MLKYLAASLLIACGTAAAQQHVWFSSGDGGRIEADAYGSGKRAVVLAHGGQFNKESWRPQAERLSATGFRVLAINFRGYGKSEGPGQKDPLSAPLYLDVLAAVRYLHASGATTIAVVGGSMGGTAAADAAIASKPGEISRVVMLGASPSSHPERLNVPTLFIVARNDSNGVGPRLPKIQADYERTPQPKRLIVVDGSGHAQFLFQTDQSERVMNEIIQFLQQ